MFGKQKKLHFPKMPEKKQVQDVKRDDGVELENQFILRILEEEPAKELREAIQTGATNLKDRLSIKMDNELRFGEIRFDQWFLHAKIMDLPTIVEALKTIDTKSFYKTADICQMMICKFDQDLQIQEEESPNKNKKKDPNKVDKKYLWPHGITPPCKNIRKRRFRKTLKKKFVEAPEIEKEVKRLLRIDNDAVNVKWDIITEEEEKEQKNSMFNQMNDIDQNSDDNDTMKNIDDKLNDDDSIKDNKPSTSGNNTVQKNIHDVGEHDIFGEELSSSDEEDNNINVELDETSRLSADDSRLSDSNSLQGQSSDKILTEFNKTMFCNSPRSNKNRNNDTSRDNRDYYDQERQDSDDDYNDPELSKQNIDLRISLLKQQLIDIKNQKAQKELEISSIENQTLRQRLQDTLDNLMTQMIEKELELGDLQAM